jgi:probable DNA metabolism protein
VLRVNEIARKVNGEAEKIRQFVRFQKTKDEIFFALISSKYNVLSLVAPHFRSRYPDQCWIIYDTVRNFGLYYDTHSLQEVTFSPEDLKSFKLKKLENEKLSETEIYYQNLWKEYFETIAIKERFNPKLQRQHMPKRFWKYLTEMQ